MRQRAGVSTLALIAATAFIVPERALAACTPNSPVGNNKTVTCTTNSPNPETNPITTQPKAKNVTVNVLSGAQLNVNGTAITLGTRGQINNFSGGLIQGQTGISGTDGVNVSNSGQITGTAGPAILLNAPGDSEIDNFGTISSSTAAAVVLNTAPGVTLTLVNARGATFNGNVSATGDGGVIITQSGTFNGGVTISGNGLNLITSDSGHDFTGPVSVTGGINTVDNGGTFNSGMTLTATIANNVANEQGAFINQTFSMAGGDNTLDNLGTLNAGVSISGNGANQITNEASASINQTFTVFGGAANTITNAGTINATMNVSGSGLVFNSGTIGGSGTAIQFNPSPGPFTLELGPGFVINGTVLGTGSDTLTLGDNGSGTFNVSNIGPQYQGFAFFDKVDSSDWTLSGSGAQNWTIDKGTLIGDTNSLQGSALTNSAELVFNQSFAGTYAGVISGRGDMTIEGGGTVAFTGANTYSGTTTIGSSGILSLGAGGTSGSVAGDIRDSGTLIFNRADTLTYAGKISGNGLLLQRGAGTTILTGASSYSGPTTVAQGTLEVDGAIARSDISVLSGATLAGNGTLGPTTIMSGGTLAPGTGPFGSQAVEGDLTFQNGANYVVSVKPLTSSTVFVTGDTSLAGTLTAVAAGSPFISNAFYPVVVTTGAVTGTFNLVQSGDFGAATLNLIYTPHDVFLNVDATPKLPPAWKATPASNNWNTPGNWVGNAVPLSTEIAHFGTSTITTVNVTQPDTEVDGLVIDAGAPHYTFSVTGSGTTPATLVLGSGGIANLSSTVGNAASFVVGGTADAPGRLVTNGSASTNVDITSNAFGSTVFLGPGSGTDIQLIANPLGSFDLSGIKSSRATTGSIEGGGQFNLGSLQVVVGGKNLSTTVSGVIADGGESGGSGASLSKIGTGTLTLSGDNSYTGQTQITSGVLQIGAGGTTGSVAGDIVDNASLVIARDGVLAYDGAISGGGVVTLSGPGIVALGGNSTYLGQTIVATGTLAIHRGSVNGTSNVSVGDGGSAELVVDQGGTLADTSATFGNLGGTTGTAFLLGSGSSWTTTGSLVIGGAGTGTIVVSDDATLAAPSITIAQQAGSTGTLVIGSLPGIAPTTTGVLDPPTITFGAGTGSLIFNHANAAYVFGTAFAGNGTVEQNGPGTTILTADSSGFTGATAVNGGTLTIAGILGSPASTLAINSGGMLGGTGTVGGAVTVNSGGVLSGAEGQTLSLGSLTLNAGANLDAALGQPGATALFNVKGSVTLDGTVNVSDLGGFSVGVYRIIDYGGALTNNGLAIGTLPPGLSPSDVQIQTAVAGEVDLVNTHGAQLAFWDGGSSPNDGAIQGGDGIWDVVSTNWTNASGAVNGPWATNFAVFEATPGTIAVDATSGAIAATGMQFAVDGYHLTGDPIALIGTAAVVRVGDGTATGAGFTASIDNVLSGSAALVKTDQGTLVLNGTNTYSGGTLIAGGTLKISSDANLGAASAPLAFASATLETTANVVSGRAVSIVQLAQFVPDATTTLELDGAITGPGDLTVAGVGAGRLILAGADSASGLTSIASGTLQLGNGGTTGTIAGNLEITGNGAFAVNRIDTVTLAGSIIGSGSFSQIGPGTTILTADSDFGGGTTIAQGTLQFGNGGALGSIMGTIADNGTLAVDRSDTFEISDPISGSGAFEQAGAGTTVLSASDTYSGGTTVTAGTLQIGDGNTSGSIVGDIVDNATLTFAHEDQVTFPGTITGSGALVQNGGGTLILTAANAYAAGTTIAQGTLQLGDGGTSGSIEGAVADNGQFVIDRSDTSEFANAISGSGGLEQRGTGVTLFTGTGTYTGPTIVSSGQLTVLGTLTGTSDVVVGDFGNATLAVTNGGTLGSDDAILGHLPGTMGTAMVSGASSSWATAGTLSIGDLGAGVLTIADAGHVSASNVFIANDVGSTGTLNIGAPSGNPAGIPGVLDPPTITFGLGSGTVVFNHTDPAYVFNAALAGLGAVEQDGPGSTTLTADSSAFTGVTTVNGGTLNVTGTLGAPGTALAVNAGGTLSGTGTVGGAVAVESGGTLSGIQGQTLTLGSLTLASGSILDVTLGAPGTTALFSVNGALTLGGTLDITDLGGFSAGVYRLIDYGGALTDNGISFGTLPPGASASDLTIQTSVANQVNLINTSGETLQFWDGPGPPNDGIMQGGSGTWNAPNTNWTNATGAVNGTWSTSFAIFGGTPGTVTVDASQGALAAEGMQFAVDGYHLTGNPIALDGAAPIIRVGDGTAAGASFTATIDNVLSGSGTLIKTDQGTLVLNGANTYTGGTLIARGTIMISSDANLGATAGALGLVNGTLETTTNITSARAVTILKSATFEPNAGTTLELDGAITGSGALTLDGVGALIIAGADSAAGQTTIAAGTLVLGNGGTSGSLAGNVVDNSVFAVNRSDTVVLNGIISGAGSFAQIGAGTTILTADDNYAGGTTITQGTLQLGNSGASGSIIGPITDNGTLVIDRSNVFAITDAISGSGALVQAGRGTTILTAANTYSGGTTIAQAVLQIGNGNVSGSILGNVTDNGILAFDRADTVTFAGTISGTGGLAQIGAGTLILTGNDTYGGGTLITSGVLQLGDGGTSGNIQGPVIDNGKFIVDRADSVTLDSAISGSGAFAQIGIGTTTLTGNSTYTGSTGIGLGTLIVQGALTGTSNVRVGDLGSATLLIENGGSVSDMRAGLGLLAGTTGTAVVSGAGSLWASSGPLIIGGAGIGTLTISNSAVVTAASVLIAQSAGSVGTLAIGALPGAVAQAPGTLDPPTVTFGAGMGSLVFNQTSLAYVFNAPIAGNGTIEQDGPGTTILTADSSAFTGTMAVNAGALVVDGTLGNLASALAVNGGGRLAGTGTVGGSVAVNSGGVLSPAGLPIGTLTVGGNLVFAPGAIYRVGLTPAAADLTTVGGMATLAGGVQVVAAPGVYPASATYPILTAAGGVNGTFDSQVTISSDFLAPTLSYSSNEVDLVLAARTFADVAQTPNQIAVANAVQSLGPSNPVFDAVFDLTNDREARHAFDALSGEVHVSSAGETMQNSRYLREAILRRLRGSLDTKGPSETVDIPMDDPPSNVWVETVAAVGDADSDGNAAGLDRSIVGIIGGLDTALDENWRAGVATAYTHSVLHEDVLGSTSSVNDFALAAYGSGQFDAFALRAGFAYDWLHDIDRRRLVAFPGFAELDTAQYSAHEMQAFGEAGYTLHEGPLALEPFANLAYVLLDTGHFDEKGGASALAESNQSLETIFTTLGTHASGIVGDIQGAPVHLDLTLAWVHAFGDVRPAMTFAFESGGAPFTIFGTPLARDSALIETGFDVDVTPAAKLSFLYSGQLATHARDNSFKATLTWNF